MLDTIYTAKIGRPVGYRHAKFISVLHTVAGSHQWMIQPLRAALLAYGRAKQVQNEDSPEPGTREGKWAKKVREYRERLAKGDAAYARETRFDALVEFLFPEVWAQLRAWDAQGNTANHVHRRYSEGAGLKILRLSRVTLFCGSCTPREVLARCINALIVGGRRQRFRVTASPGLDGY